MDGAIGNEAVKGKDRCRYQRSHDRAHAGVQEKPRAEAMHLERQGRHGEAVQCVDATRNGEKRDVVARDLKEHSPQRQVKKGRSQEGRRHHGGQEIKVGELARQADSRETTIGHHIGG